MAHDLFMNTVILIAFITLGNQIIYRKFKVNTSSSYKLQLASGLLNGIVGCVLILYSFDAINGVVLDFRHGAIVIASVLGGPISALISGLMIGTFRILRYGLSETSIAAFITVVCIGIGCAYISLRATSFKRKWIFGNIMAQSLVSISFVGLIRDGMELLRILLVFWSINVLGAFILYYYLGYIIATNELFRKYKEEATVDYLTGLNNVRQFDIIYNMISEKTLEKEEHLSLLYLDIDYFKKVNDTYGHAEGDIVLRELANILRRTCRDYDIISRNGGEEFSVMLLDCPAQKAVAIAEKIRTTVEKHTFRLSNGKELRVTISVGVACYPDSTADIANLKEEADTALYKAKHSGRNKVVI